MERPWWQRALYEIWPKIYRVINASLYFLMMTIRNTVITAIEQIKNTF